MHRSGVVATDPSRGLSAPKGEGRLPTVSRTMKGVTHRTKRDKHGLLVGYRETWRMFSELVALPLRGKVRLRTYWFYLRGLTVDV